jgi:DNA-binding LytR/AlgR family response regulator
MITAIAIDDEAPALRVIENFCSQTEGIRLEQTFLRPRDALSWLTQSPVDLLFLDIRMPSQSGLDLYKNIESAPLVIFTTAYSEYAVEGFNLNAIDYLLKPFTLERFRQAVNKAAEYLSFRQSPDHQEETLLIKADYSLIKIRTADILFVEAADDYLKIYQDNKPPLVVRMTMKSLTAMLPATGFIRTHRSYIVALRRIENVRNRTIAIAGKSIPIGTNYETDFFRQFKQ